MAKKNGSTRQNMQMKFTANFEHEKTPGNMQTKCMDKQNMTKKQKTCNSQPSHFLSMESKPTPTYDKRKSWMIKIQLTQPKLFLLKNMDASSSRPCKRQKRLEPEVLRKLLGTGVSEKGILEVLNSLRGQEPLPASTFKRHVKEVLSTEVSLFRVHHLPSKENGQVPVVIADIPSMLSHFSENERYKQILTLALAGSRNGVLETVLYHDDIQGGNILAPSLGKKATLCYMSFMSLPKKHLLSPFAWLIVGLLTHSDLQRIDGGLSAYTALICKQFLTTPCKTGFVLRGLNGRGCKINLSWFTADFDAIRTTFLSRGSAGLRPCLNCANVVKKDAQLNDPFFVEISVATLDKCVPVKDQEFLRQCDRLQGLVTAGSTKKDIENLAFRLGLHYNKHGLLWDKDVRELLPPSKVIPDTLHSYMANGIASQEIMLVWGQATALGLDQNAVFEVLHVFDLQRADVHHRTLTWQKHLFSEKKLKGDLYGGPGWECELMVPLLFFLCSRLLHRFSSLGPALECLHLLQLCCREVRLHLRFHMSKTKLLDLQSRHHKAFLKAYSADAFRPKHHHRLHIPQGPILSVAAMETKHREFKRNLSDRLQSLVHKTEANVAKAALPRMHGSGALSNFGFRWCFSFGRLVRSHLQIIGFVAVVARPFEIGSAFGVHDCYDTTRPRGQR